MCRTVPYFLIAIFALVACGCGYSPSVSYSLSRQCVHGLGLATWPAVLTLLQSLGWTGWLAGVVLAFLVGVTLNIWRLFRSLPALSSVTTEVQSALDSLPEGIVLIDADAKIVTANQVFARSVSKAPAELAGRKLSSFVWQTDAGLSNSLPWQECLQTAVSIAGSVLQLQLPGQTVRSFRVSCSPLDQNVHGRRGVVVSFADVTHLQEKQTELTKLLNVMRESTVEIRRENRRLERLATRDPLTSCYNRRSFHEHFESHWNSARRHGFPLACVLIDIDHFKLINDNYGHPAGDDVLCQFAELVRKSARDSDVICRYGGEEFAILLPHTTLDAAREAAERLRANIETSLFAELQVTASFGVSEMSLGANSPEVLIDQTDRCLLAAKRDGRNRVVAWDTLSEDSKSGSRPSPRPTLVPDQTTIMTIPFSAVNALVTVLAFRDADTAEHSRRVADLCLMASEGLLPHTSRHVLETAALLHDIGKIGVPDSILLKPGPLTDGEFAELRKHQRIGVEIIRTAFAAAELSDMVAYHHLPFAPAIKVEQLDEPANTPMQGEEIPLGARILSIANAYDAMVSDRVFRAGMPVEQAFAELRRCAGQQFDPELVEHFIQVLKATRRTLETAKATQPRQSALDIGQQVERLLTAIDSQDVGGIRALSSRISDLAMRYGMEQVAVKAARLESVTATAATLESVLASTRELIEECRASQTQPTAGPSTSA